MGKARVTPSSKIEEGLQQSTPRSKEIKDAAPAESAAPAGEVQEAPAEPAGMETEESIAEGIIETVIQEDVTVRTKMGKVKGIGQASIKVVDSCEFKHKVSRVLRVEQ